MKPLSCIWASVLAILGSNILSVRGYDDDYDEDVNRNTFLIWVIIVIIVIIIKIAVVVWYVLRRRRRQQAMMRAPNLCPARLPGQSPYPTVPGSQIPYGTPQAAYGYPAYPQGYPQGYSQASQPAFAPLPGQQPTPGAVLPPYQESAPPPYEVASANDNEGKTSGYQKL